MTSFPSTGRQVKPDPAIQRSNELREKAAWLRQKPLDQRLFIVPRTIRGCGKATHRPWAASVISEAVTNPASRYWDTVRGEVERVFAHRRIAAGSQIAVLIENNRADAWWSDHRPYLRSLVNAFGLPGQWYPGEGVKVDINVGELLDSKRRFAGHGDFECLADFEICTDLDAPEGARTCLFLMLEVIGGDCD